MFFFFICDTAIHFLGNDRHVHTILFIRILCHCLLETGIEISTKTHNKYLHKDTKSAQYCVNVVGGGGGGGGLFYVQYNKFY